MPVFKNPYLIHNPTAGKSWSGRLNRPLIHRLKEWLPTLEIKQTKGAGHATELARFAVRGGSDLVIATGGDGTVNEVVNGMIGTDTVMAYLPTGTGNTMARELNLPVNPMKAVDSLRNGEVRDCYVGLADQKYFSLMVGVGFDGDAVRRVPYRLKRLLGRLSYIWAGGLAMFRYPFPVFSVIIDGKTFKATTLIVAKSKFYASRFRIVPDMSLDQPMFGICLFPGRGSWNTIRYIASVLLDRHTLLPDVVLLKAREVQIEAVPGMFAQMDGEALQEIPKRIRIAEQQIRMLTPR